MSMRVRVIKSRYVDSVILMRLAERLAQLDGIDDAAALMGTTANKALLQESGFVETPPAAKADDLVVAVKAAADADADAALAQVEELLDQRRAAHNTRSARTLEQALELDPEINLAAISLPGEYATAEARRALERGLHVFLFSSNVALGDEIALKTLAAERGLLCMGPDCGTALIAGKALGFGNAVRRGPVGVVGAAGSGIQAVTSYLDRLGVGVSHAIGCGGRDLSDAVGARTMRAGLEALLADDETTAILLLSKPPSPTVATELHERAAAARKPVICCFLGESGPETLDDAARAAAAAVGVAAAPPTPALDDNTIRALTGRLSPTQHNLRALYAGGTLAYEAQLILGRRGLTVSSNAPLPGAAAFDGNGHVVLDMGAEEFTSGRPHPMIDARERRARVLSEADDPSVAVILLDFVLGFGAAADPAGDLAEAIMSARRHASDDRRELVIIAFVCGTAADPQNIVEQEQRLREAGALVFDTNAGAVENAARLITAANLAAPAVATTAGGGR